MTLKDCVKNIIHGVYNTIPHLFSNQTAKHNTVRSISIKTFNSVSLPIYNHIAPEEIKALHNTKTD